MKQIKNLDEFVRQYKSSPNLKETGKGILATWGEMTFVFHDDEGPPFNEKHVVNLTAEDVDRIIHALEGSK